MRNFLFLFLLSFSSVLKAQVVLLSFEVTKNTSNNYEVIAEWSTSIEINSDYFILERSADGVNYSTLKHVPAAENSSSIINYSTTDNSEILSACYYYRLQIVSKDSSFELTNAKTVCFPPPILVNCENKLTLFPNPIKDISFICLDNQNSEKYNIFIYDIQGKIIEEIVGFEANYVFFSTSTLKSGVYFYKLFKGTNHIKTEKFIVL